MAPSFISSLVSGLTGSRIGKMRNAAGIVGKRLADAGAHDLKGPPTQDIARLLSAHSKLGKGMLAEQGRVRNTRLGAGAAGLGLASFGAGRMTAKPIDSYKTAAYQAGFNSIMRKRA